MNVLAINSGSSSLKFKVVEFDESADAADGRQLCIRYEGSVEELGPAAKLQRMVRSTSGTPVECPASIREPAMRRAGSFDATRVV